MMQLKIRDLTRFGISGLMSESGSVFYSSDFKTRSLGRVSDLIAAKLKDIHADELRLRALLLYGLYESNALADPQGEKTNSVGPVSLEVGLESDYLVIGVSFNWSENARPDFTALESRVAVQKEPANDFEKILSLIHQNSDHVYVRYCEEPRQIEVVSIIGFGGSERVGAVRLEVLQVDIAQSEALPNVSEYKELGDLPYVELTKEEEAPSRDPARLHTDDLTTVSGWEEEAETEQKISGLPQEAEVVQNVSGSDPEAEESQNVKGSDPEAEALQKIAGSPIEEIDGMSVISAQEAEDGIEAELRKVQGLPTEKEIFNRLKADGFSESELLMLRQGNGFTPEVRLRLQASNVLPEEIQRVQILGQQQQFVQKLETSGFSPLEIQKITSGTDLELDLIRKLASLGYQPPEVQSLFSDSFELAERIYQIRSGDDPAPIEAYRRVAAPIFTREELLAKIRIQFPELGDVDALKASNEEYQRLAEAARAQIQKHSGGELPKSNDDMANWLSSFSHANRPDFKSIPFNPNQIHAVQAAFGTSQVDTKALSEADYEKFMDAIRKPSQAADRRNQSNDHERSFQSVEKKKPFGSPKVAEVRKVSESKLTPKEVSGARRGDPFESQTNKQDQLEAELLKKRIRELENQLKVEKSTQQSQFIQQSQQENVARPGITRSSSYSSQDTDQKSEPGHLDPIEKIEIKGESRRIVSRSASEPEKKNKETLFTKLFNKKEEENEEAKIEKSDATSVLGRRDSSSDIKTVISASNQATADESSRLVQGSNQNRAGLSGVDQKEFEKVKRELALKEKRHQEQSDLLQRKLGTIKESLDKSERERVSAIREREKLKAELEQARIRIASAQIPEVRTASTVQDETITVVKGGSGQPPASGAGAKVVPIRDSKTNTLLSNVDQHTTTAQAPEQGQNKEQSQSVPPKQADPQPAKKSGGFGSKLLKSLNPFSSDSKDKEPPKQVPPASKGNPAVDPSHQTEAERPNNAVDTTKTSTIEGVDPRVLAMKEKVHERQVDELHRKIKKLEEDNSKLREKSIRVDSQVLDQKTKTIRKNSDNQQDAHNEKQSDPGEGVLPDSKNEIEARKRKIEEEDQKILTAAAAVEPAVLKLASKEALDPETRAHSAKTEKTLDDLKSALEKPESPNLKKVISEIQQNVEPSKSKQWTESLMSEVVSEKARIMELQRTLNMEFKAAEQGYRNRENALQADLQKKDDTLRQKEALLNRKNDLLAQLNVQLDQLKQGSLAVEEAQLKHKLAAAQKLAEMKDFENKTMLEKNRDLENKLMIANAKARNTNESQWKQKIQALEFKLEEAKKQAQRNQDLSSQTNTKANDRELFDIKKKYEVVERQQQEMRKLLDRTAANLKEKTESERRFQLDAQKLQEENKKLKALISRAGGSSNAA